VTIGEYLLTIALTRNCIRKDYNFQYESQVRDSRDYFRADCGIRVSILRLEFETAVDRDLSPSRGDKCSGYLTNPVSIFTLNAD
jgi:hypothetical protein